MITEAGVEASHREYARAQAMADEASLRCSRSARSRGANTRETRALCSKRGSVSAKPPTGSVAAKPKEPTTWSAFGVGAW